MGQNRAKFVDVLNGWSLNYLENVYLLSNSGHKKTIYSINGSNRSFLFLFIDRLDFILCKRLSRFRYDLNDVKYS